MIGTEGSGLYPPAGSNGRAAVFAALIVASIAAALPVVRQLWEYSQVTDSASHVVLVPAVTLALLWMERASIFGVVRTSWSGLALIGAGAVLGLAANAGIPAAHAGASLWWSVTALVVVWAGVFLLVFGGPAFRAARFPLLFLLFTVPLPETVLVNAVTVLKSGSADAVAALFSLTATPYFRTGFVFELPGVAIEIADECSGVRSSIALTLTGLLAGHLFLDSTWKKVVLVLAVLPITIFKNAVRIVSLSLLSIHVDPSFLVGQLHHDGGVVFFLFALGLLVPLMALLRRPGLMPGRRQRVSHAPSR